MFKTFRLVEWLPLFLGICEDPGKISKKAKEFNRAKHREFNRGQTNKNKQFMPEVGFRLHYNKNNQHFKLNILLLPKSVVKFQT